MPGGDRHLSIQVNELEYHLQYLFVPLPFEDGVKSAQILESHHIFRFLGLLLLELGNTTISIGTLLLIVLLLGRAREHDEDFPAEGIWHVHAENLALELLMAYRLEQNENKSSSKSIP